MKKIKPLPATMTVLSALYLVYVLSSEDTTLVADAVGGDPGGKVLPIAMAIFMILGFLWITIRERPDGTRTERETHILFWITFSASALYVFLIRPVGFVLLSVLLLYTLLYIFSTIGEKRSTGDGLLGGAGTLAITTGGYYLMRYVTKTLMRLGISGALPPIFASTTFEAAISLTLVTALIVLLLFTVYRALKKTGRKRSADAFLITFATILLLYVVFKQFFNVNLAPGLLNY